MKTADFLLLLSKIEINKKDILPNYYARQAIEQIFIFAKPNNNTLPLRVNSNQSVRHYIMLSVFSVNYFYNCASENSNASGQGPNHFAWTQSKKLL